MKIDLSRFDPYQLEIINENSGKDIVVGASAGAGKTMVLVARVMKRCMEDRIPVSRILALTFTAAAAEEMKNRLSRQFHDLRETTDDPEETAWIDEQISRLVTADITTIDSYCLNIIRRFCSTIGLDPSTAANILSEGKNELLEREAFRQALSHMCGTEEGFRDVLQLCEYISTRPEDYEKLYETVKEINAHALSAVDPQDFWRRAKATYAEFKTMKQLPDIIRDAWFEMLYESCERILDTAHDIKNSIEEESDKKIKPEMIIQTINLMSHAMHCAGQNDYEGFQVLLKDAAVNKIPKAEHQKNEQLRQKLHTQISSLLEISYDQESFAKNSGIQAGVIQTLVTLCEKSAETFRKLKEQNAVMNFSDMERYALEILHANNGRVAKQLNHSFDEIMIDEFQDTSFLQDTILTEIAKADRNVPVFRVGDVKQSIYRFRLAKPQLMRDLMMDEEHTAVFNMRYNYRSDSGIVEFTNLLFERLMNLEGIQDSYGEKDHVDVGTPGQRVVADRPAVRMYLLDKPKEAEETGKKKPAAREVKNDKASFIAQKICEMIEESGGKLRFRDFAVLSRSHGDQIVLKRYFEKYGIPYDIDSREGFFQSDLCRDILSAARLIRDPEDEIALAAVVTSPLFSLSDQQMAEARLHADSFHEGIYALYPSVKELFTHYHEVLVEKGVIELLSTIANTEVSHPLVSGPSTFYDALSRKDQANFDYLFDLSVSAGLYTLDSLIREIEDGEAEKSSEAITTGKDDSVVTVTTIHHSKGLQYPIVFLWGTGKNLFSDGSEPVLIDDELMLGIRDIDMHYRTALPTVQRILVQERSSQEDCEEFTRVLYVAVTRAQKQLIIVDQADACEERAQKMDISVISKRTGITGLITAALDHDPGVNEDGLFEVRHVIHEETPEKFRYLTEGLRVNHVTDLPRLKITPEIFPDIKTPSSLERSRSALNEGRPALPAFAPKNTGGSNYGTLMHKACEDMPDDREWTEELIREVMDPSLGEKAVHDLYAFGHSDLYQRCRDMAIYKEYPFYYESPSARINGTIDFLAVGEKEIILIDFKTDKLTPEEIAHEYSPQLNTYKDVVHSFWPEHSIELYAWSFHNGCQVPIAPETD